MNEYGTGRRAPGAGSRFGVWRPSLLMQRQRRSLSAGRRRREVLARFAVHLGIGNRQVGCGSMMGHGLRVVPIGVLSCEVPRVALAHTRVGHATDVAIVAHRLLGTIHVRVSRDELRAPRVVRRIGTIRRIRVLADVVHNDRRSCFAVVRALHVGAGDAGALRSRRQLRVAINILQIRHQ